MKKIDRIIAALPKNKEHRMNALDVIIAMARGESAHIYHGWTNRFRRLTKATGVPCAIKVLDAAGIDYVEGNDAPRGGVLGEYIKFPRRCPSIIPALEEVLAADRNARK